jgi:hypothetical protein
MLTSDTQCDGNGNCSQGPTMVQCPNNLACNAGMTACLASCAGHDSNCASGFYCNSNVCTAQQGHGAACSASDQCSSGTCCTGAGAPSAGCTAAGCL